MNQFIKKAIISHCKYRGHEIIDMSFFESHDDIQLSFKLNLGKFFIYVNSRYEFENEETMSEVIVRDIESTLNDFEKANKNKNSLFQFIENQILLKIDIDYGVILLHLSNVAEDFSDDIAKTYSSAETFLIELDNIDLSPLYNESIKNKFNDRVLK